MKIHKIWLLVIAHSLCISLLASEVAPAPATPAPAESSNDDEAEVVSQDDAQIEAEHKESVGSKDTLAQALTAAAAQPSPAKKSTPLAPDSAASPVQPSNKSQHAPKSFPSKPADAPEQIAPVGLFSIATEQIWAKWASCEDRWTHHATNKTVPQTFPSSTAKIHNFEKAVNELLAKAAKKEQDSNPKKSHLKRLISLLKTGITYNVTANDEILRQLDRHADSIDSQVQSLRDLVNTFRSSKHEKLSKKDDEKSSKKDNE